MDLNIRRNNELISILNLGDERKIEFRTNSASYTQRDIKLAATRTAPAPKVIWTSKGNVKTKSKTCLQCNWITRQGRLMQTYHIHTSTTPHALVPVWKHHIYTMLITGSEQHRKRYIGAKKTQRGRKQMLPQAVCNVLLSLSLLHCFHSILTHCRGLFFFFALRPLRTILMFYSGAVSVQANFCFAQPHIRSSRRHPM